MAVIALDIGGTKMLAGLVTTAGTVLASELLPTRAATYLEDATTLGRAMVAEAGRRRVEVTGFGVGTTGMVDHGAGVLRRSLGLGLTDVPIRTHLEAALRVPAFVDNDIHAAALGELFFGIGREHDDFLLLNAGTGLSVGIVIGGRLHRGATNAAGEVGHTSVWAHGPACRCGLPGCVEDLVVRARDGEEVPDVALGGEAAPNAAFAYLALTAINLVNLFNPSAIVLAGGMFTRQPNAMPWLEAAVRRHSLEAAVAGLSAFALSQAGPQAGLLGAAALAFERSAVGHTLEGVDA